MAKVNNLKKDNNLSAGKKQNPNDRKSHYLVAYNHKTLWGSRSNVSSVTMWMDYREDWLQRLKQAIGYKQEKGSSLQILSVSPFPAKKAYK